MKYLFECDDGETYTVEAESFVDAKDRFATFDWNGDAPKILSYCASFDGVGSVLKISIVA